MNEELDKRIDLYLLGLMPEEERYAFEKEMQMNPNLAEEVLLRRDIIIGLHAAERRRLMEELQAYIHENYSREAQKRRTLILLLIMIGGGILLALLWLILQKFFMTTQF